MYSFLRGTSKVSHLNEMSLHFLSWYSLYIALYLACYFCLVFRISSLQIVSPGDYLMYFREFVTVSLVIQSFLFSLDSLQNFWFMDVSSLLRTGFLFLEQTKLRPL